MKQQKSLPILGNVFPLFVIAVSFAGMPPGRSNPITVTGYTHDVVYEIGATSSGNGTFTNENSALYEEGLDPDPNGGNGTGLPVNRTLTDLVGGDFSLAPYNGLNALMVGEGNGLNKFATWTFAPEAKVPYGRLSVVGLSAGGQSNFSFVVFFTDSTHTGIEFEGRPDIRGAFDGNVMPDWFQNGGTSDGVVVSGLGRVDSNNGNGNGVGVNLQQWNFDLTPYAGKSVDHVEFEATGGGGNNRAFLAISGTPLADPPAELKIISSQFDFIGDQLQLTWSSADNKTYRITSSTDLSDWSNILESNIPGATGLSQTNRTVNFTQGTKQFFRVEEE